MTPLIVLLIIVAVGGWLLAVLGWLAFYGSEDQHNDTRNTLRDQVYRRLDAEAALENATAQIKWHGGRQ